MDLFVPSQNEREVEIWARLGGQEAGVVLGKEADGEQPEDRRAAGAGV